MCLIIICVGCFIELYSNVNLSWRASSHNQDAMLLVTKGAFTVPDI